MKLLRDLAVAVLLIVSSTGPSAAQTQSAGKIAVADAWSRATPAGSKTAVVYMTLVNGGAAADRLVGATTPVADKVAFHSNTNDNGVMQMRELPAIDVEPGAKVVLKPGGTHIMLVGLKQQLKEGQTLPLTLEFENAGKIELQVPIAKIGAMGNHGMSGM
jgi:periplasmic copper chaperone A